MVDISGGENFDKLSIPNSGVGNAFDRANSHANSVQPGALIKMSLKTRQKSALYLFAGKSRRSDVGNLLKAQGWLVLELDIIRDRTHDISLKSVQDKIRGWVREKRFDALLASPPCDTFTRAKMANFLGPPPARDFHSPRGFAYLSWSSRRSVVLANALVDFTFEILEMHCEIEGSLAILEHPEDLGAMTSGPYLGVRPASIWQFPGFSRLIKIRGVRTVGVRQSDFGTEYIKPTRLVLKVKGPLPALFFEGAPVFNNAGNYIGPIPRAYGKVSLARRKGDKSFRTTGTACWPLPLCKTFVELLGALPAEGVSSAASHSPGSFLQGSEDDWENSTIPLDPAPPTSFLTVVPPADHWVGGLGSVRKIQLCGKSHEFHDGGGLISPGRWDKSQRTFPSDLRWRNLRRELRDAVLGSLDDLGIQKQMAALACGKDAIFDQSWPGKVRSALHLWLGKQCNDYTDSPTPFLDSGQPFYLDLIFFLAREAKDPDFMFVKDLKEGVTAGILSPLPRVPAIYEEQTRWRLVDDPLETAALLNENYSSVEKHIPAVRAQFLEDQAELRMLEFPAEVFFKKYVGGYAISALAVLEEKDKLRVLHDGTHVTRVNHKIKCLNRLRMPSAKEKFYLLDGFRTRKNIALSIIGDVSKAHRLIKMVESEWGYLACQIEPDKVWVNKVGTFGISSAAFWWSRLSSLILRLVHFLVGPDLPIDILLFADDIEWLAEVPAERASILLSIVLFLALGTPLKWSKFRGGYEVDWIGLHTAYRTYSLGISASRANWLVLWMRKIRESGCVHVREFSAALGRINFAVCALIYEKPFLGPLYLWSSAIQRSSSKTGIFKVPWAIRLILSWLSSRLEKGGRLQEAPKRCTNTVEWFRTDAKAENGKAFIGGWEVSSTRDTKKARWYAIEVEHSWAPWINWKGDPQRVIASLELLGTIIAIMVFDQDEKAGKDFGGTLTGSTDNKGNTFATAKLMSTKFPLTVLIMELSEQLRCRGATLALNWLQRDLNQEADDLTNLEFGSFDMKNRIPVDPTQLKWLVLPTLMEESEALYKQIIAEKESLKKDAVPVHRPRKVHPTKRLKCTDPW